MVFSPLEQFQIYPIFQLSLGLFDISITNAAVLFLLTIFSTLFLLYSLGTENTMFLVPNRVQYFFELLYETTSDLLSGIVGPTGKYYFPYVFTIFTFILTANVIGLVPYSFTVTSHLIVTLALALMTFIAINIIGVKKHGFEFISFFLPPGQSVELAFLLVPVELISYIFRPISLSVRLFANMMAGHTLLKVIAGFAYSMVLAGGGLLIAHFIPLVILVLLMFLEFMVALIQAYIFTILTCLYLNDAINLH